MSAPEDQRPQFNPLARRSWTDLGPRIASAIVLLLVAAVGLYFGSYVFGVLVAAVFAGCYREWERMVTIAFTDWSRVGPTFDTTETLFDRTEPRILAA